MNLRRISTSLLLIFMTLFSACAPSMTAGNDTPIPDGTTSRATQPATRAMEATGTPITQPTATITPSPSRTIQPTKTITPTRKPTKTDIPIFGSKNFLDSFPTVSVGQMQTATQSPAALCPETTLTDEIPLTFTLFGYLDEKVTPSTDEEILSFLNAHGPESLLGKNLATEYTYDDEPVIGYLDLTNDGVNELILNHNGFLRIYGCMDKFYEMLFSGMQMSYRFPFWIQEIADLNMNGIPEIYLEVNTRTQAGRDFNAIEWNGKEFTWVLRNLDGSGGVNVAPGYLSYEDIDRDEMKEVVAISEIPVWSLYYFGLPWRTAREVYKWNGEVFLFYREILDPPEFRFQAVQDGDLAVFAGDYAQALDFYWNAINSETLLWFSEGRRDTMRARWDYRYMPTPGPNLTLPAMDPLEYNYLAAYSYFKIIAVHTLLGETSKAAQVMETLRINYPDGKAGSIFTEMAEVFLQAYQETNHINTACDQALSFAEENWAETTRYLGNTEENGSYFGWQSLNYSIKNRMLCPLTDETIP